MSTQTADNRIVVAGASGQIGRELVRELERGGRRVMRLVRREPRSEDEARWDPNSRLLDPRLLDGAAAVVNLAGSRLSRLPWTYNVKKDILRSRVNATLTITEALERSIDPPAALLNASATGVYGDRPDEELDEGSGIASEGFLPRVVERWEAAARTAPQGVRVVLLRTGMVVGGEGGFVAVLKRLGQFGLLAKLGDGRQHWPWISMRDEVRAIVHLLDSGLRGPVNLVGPEPASAERLLQALADELGKPMRLSAPGQIIDFTLREAGRELFLADQRILPRALLDDGFRFREGTAQQAVELALLELSKERRANG
ncbi:MAG: TIGR01777 family oxidoreductase [Pseudoclavibacter sp.]|nr:TIGR01777 family oxidoreductase [Pseudoclavibacter sp.]